MADPMEEAKHEAEAHAADDERAEQVHGVPGRHRLSAKAVFGDPVEKDGVTVVPVAPSALRRRRRRGPWTGTQEEGRLRRRRPGRLRPGRRRAGRTGRLHRAVRRQGHLQGASPTRHAP